MRCSTEQSERTDCGLRPEPFDGGARIASAIHRASAALALPGLTTPARADRLALRIEAWPWRFDFQRQRDDEAAPQALAARNRRAAVQVWVLVSVPLVKTTRGQQANGVVCDQATQQAAEQAARCSESDNLRVTTLLRHSNALRAQCRDLAGALTQAD